MSKGKKKNKSLRREVEVLKAQLKSNNDGYQTPVKNNPVKETKKQTGTTFHEKTIDKEAVIQKEKLIKQDLIKTFAISFVCFATVIGLWVYLK